MRVSMLTLAFALSSAGCLGSAGGDLFEITAVATGPEGVDGSYELDTGRGYHVLLTRAKLHIGAVYLNRSVPTSVGSDTSCTLAGTYVAEVTTGVDVDVLSGARQPFPLPGFATSDHATAGELWLTGGDVNDETDTTVILDIAGTADKGGVEYPFEGSITIGSNRVVAPSDPALPGAKPICKRRIVTPIPVDVRPTEGGTLVVRIDPAGWFGNVELSKLEQVEADPPLYRFHDASDDQPSTNLFNGLLASIGPYALRWEAAH